MKNRSGKKAGLIIFILILLILLIVAAGAYAYFVTDLFKTPEQLFKKYFLSNVIQLTGSNFEPFNEINERSENEVTEYSLNIGIDPTALDETLEEGEKYDVNLTLTTDMPNKNEDIELLVNKNEKEFLKGTIALTNETLGISVPDLYDKYIAVENRDFKKMAKTFELSDEYIEMIPDKIPSGFTAEEEEKINELTTKYVTKITEQFQEDNYMAEKDINIVVNSKELIANKYSLSISSKAVYTALTGAISELLEDPEFLALCENRISTEQLDKIKTAYKESLEETNVDDVEDKLIKFSVYAVDGKTVKTELEVDENEAYFAIDNNENESVMIFSSEEPRTESNDVGTTSVITIKNTYTNNSGELTYEVATTYNKDDIKTVQAEYDAEYSDFGEAFERDYSEIYSDETVKYIIKTTKPSEDTIKGSITFEGNEDLEMITNAANISFKCQFGKATVETLDESNSEIINDYTMEDYQNLITNIGTNLMTVAMEKPDSFIGMLMANSSTGSSDDYYSDDYYSDDYYSDDYSSGDYTFDDYDYTYDDYYSDDSTSDDYYSSDDITLPEDENNDNYLNPTTSFDPEATRINIELDITDGLNNSLNDYKLESYMNENANLGDFLTVENVQKHCGDKYALELIDSTTIKCTVLGDTEYVYYALMNIDGNTLVVTDVEVLTEEEYLNR